MFAFISCNYPPNCDLMNLLGNGHSCQKCELSVTIRKICTEYFKGLLERGKGGEQEKGEEQKPKICITTFTAYKRTHSHEHVQLQAHLHLLHLKKKEEEEVSIPCIYIFMMYIMNHYSCFLCQLHTFREQIHISPSLA